MSGWWACLDEQTRQAVDAEVLRDRRMMAVKAVWEALRPLGLGLRVAEEVVHLRYTVLGERVRGSSSAEPADVPTLAARAAGLPGRVVAVEALWDGDTVHDWFVMLIAVLDEPAGEGHLATFYRSPDARPLGRVAAEVGRGLADHLGVPFHFASPDVPDGGAPRRR
ncbi:hypothetical protein ACFW6S_32125 [Streptomyces sp. NPDC058740]|uniref:hypothetical protein n=1 Tax=Streptomyces sp. NPDC058740 TaxID=3346619 RepID=UPI00369FD6C2